jgi:hypothetical protein
VPPALRFTDPKDDQVHDDQDMAMTGFLAALRRRLPLVHYVVDCLVWLVALPLTAFSRYDFTIGEMRADAMVRAWLIAVVGQGVFGLASGLYTRRWRYGSFDEVAALATTVLLTGFAMSIVHFLWFMPACAAFGPGTDRRRRDRRHRRRPLGLAAVPAEADPPRAAGGAPAARGGYG